MDIDERRVSSWDDIDGYGHLPWIYRGQRQSEWPLATTLERCCDREEIPPHDRARFEAELQRDFRRVYPEYMSRVPAATAPVEWLALMQHHGAPTRLLDFTYSIYVAAYFAFEHADSDCAVWAVDAPWALRESVEILTATGADRAKTLLARTSEAHEAAWDEALFQSHGRRFALPTTPFLFNERLRTQRGTFLVPGDVSSSFMDNLRALPKHDCSSNLIKLVLPHTLRQRTLERLNFMNISRMSLFPGLDGYAESLGVYHPSFRPTSWS